MNRNIVFLIRLILVGMTTIIPLKSQVILTQSNHAPVPGDIEIIKEFDTTANIVNVLNVSGNNVLYDFSQKIIHGNNTFTNTYVTPSVLPGSSSYISMGANVALSDSGGFYKSSAGSLEYCGHMNASGEKMEFLFDKPIMMNYPFSYNSFFSDFAQGTMNAPIAPPFNLTATISCSGMGQGTLQLPGNAPINNILVVKRNIFMLIQGTGSLSAVTGTQTIIQYEFYKIGSKFPIMRVQYNKLVVPAFNVNDFDVQTEYDGSIILNTNKETYTMKSFNVFPQPAKEFIRLSGIEFIESPVGFKIFDINGKLITNGVVFKEDEPINVSDLSNGLYILEVSTLNATYRKKIVKN
jgi:hypothetical protein